MVSGRKEHNYEGKCGQAKITRVAAINSKSPAELAIFYDSYFYYIAIYYTKATKKVMEKIREHSDADTLRINRKGV